MQFIAYQKMLRTSPRKLRLVADSVRAMAPAEALVHLDFIHKRAAGMLRTVMKQAVSNAWSAQQVAADKLVTKHIMIEEGPRYKRFRAAPRGRARMVQKKTSHIKVVLESKTEEIAETENKK